MTKLGRHDLKETPDTFESHEELAGRAKATKPLPSPPKTLRLADIRVARQVFQWRSRSYGDLQKQEHTLDLARALNDGRRFPPLTVYRIADRYYVLDGHHRLDAYHTVAWTKPVPVDAFEGTFEDAWTYALKANSATKLPMSRDEKSEAAWRLTKTTKLTAERVNALAGTSVRSVFYMRKVWKKLCDREDIEDISWQKARRIAEGAEYNGDKDWRERKTEELTGHLKKSLSKFLKYPDITADALRMLDPDLPRALIQEWASQERDFIQDLANQKGIEF